MNKISYLLLALSSAFCFISHGLISILGGTLIFRYIGYAIICFSIPLILFIKFHKKAKKALFIFTLPILLNLLVTIHSSYLSNDFYTLPLGLTGVISVFLAYITFKYYTKIIKKISFIFLLTILITSYIYANWLYGWEREITNKLISNELVIKEAGNTFILESKKNKVIVLDVWSTSCGICIQKFPEFEKQYLRYKNNPDVELYSLYLPVKRDSTLDITKYTKNYSFPKLYAQDIDSWNQLDISGLPLIIMIDKKGKVRFRGAMNTNKYLPYNNFNNLIEKLKNE